MNTQAYLISNQQICSEVTSFIYISGVDVAKDREQLQRHGITHVLNCAGTVCENYFEGVRIVCPPTYPLSWWFCQDATVNIRYTTLYLMDGKLEDIASFFFEVRKQSYL